MQIRDRIKEFRRLPASSLLDNPKNWRLHPKEQQAALDAVLAEIGFAGAELVFETPDGLMLIDGHDRKRSAGDEIVPVLVTDLTQEEADLLLATYDPISAMARADQARLDELIGGIETEDAELQKLLDGLAGDEIVEEQPELVSIDTKPPPVMTWVLVGIPTIRFGEISLLVEQIAGVPDIVLETTSNDG